MNRNYLLGIVVALVLTSTVFADDFIQRYAGDSLPLDTAGWQVFNPCEDECTEILDNGHFVLQWVGGADQVNYDFLITDLPVIRPDSLWVEWRFRSNNPWPQIGFTCDASFFVQWNNADEVVQMFSDTAFSFSGDYFIQGLNPNEYHTYRYESVDGTNYRVSVDGIVFIDQPNSPTLGGASLIQFRGRGGCSSNNLPVVINEWDFVRSGTVTFGETIVATDPPTGFVNPLDYPNLDRFVVTFDAANYAYPEDITIGVTGGIIPFISKTRRRDNDAPTNLEVVLSRPLAMGQTTTFTFNDGVASNEVAFTYGCPNPADNIDTDGDGVVNCMDDCPNDPTKTLPGQCGCGNSDADADSDGTADCNDGCPADPNKIDPGQCGCGQPEDNVGDSDGDSVADCIDQCPEGNDAIDLNGNNTPDCAEAVPAVSTWGLVVLTLLILTMAKCPPRHKTSEDVRP